ncbi:MAG TPA: helix-turn-helix domain-containing protein [Candidatus Acidoferrales bacterium]
MNTLSEVWQKFAQNKAYRSAFARAQFKRLVPLQIQTLRKKRGWSQHELAEQAAVTQGVVSRAEDQDYGNLTVNTILKIAEGFDVAFVGRFVPFSELDRWYVNLSSRTMNVPSFDEENDALYEFENTARSTAKGRDESLIAVDARFKNERETGMEAALANSAIVLSPTEYGGGLAHAGIGGHTS